MVQQSAAAPHAARTVSMNLPTSRFSRLLSLESDCAAESTCDDAAPRQTSIALGDRLESRNVVLTLLKYVDQRLSSESDARLGRTLNEVC